MLTSFAQKELELMLLCTFRYALGRMSYIVSDVAELIEKHWDSISKSHQGIILKELTKALADHEADRENSSLHPYSGKCGMDMDYEVWKNLWIKLNGKVESTG